MNVMKHVMMSPYSHSAKAWLKGSIIHLGKKRAIQQQTLFVYHTSVHKRINLSPFELLYGRKPTLPIYIDPFKGKDHQLGFAQHSNTIKDNAFKDKRWLKFFFPNKHHFASRSFVNASCIHKIKILVEYWENSSSKWNACNSSSSRGG